MPSLTSEVPNVENGVISPNLRMTMAGCVLAFLVITAGFILVARHKKRRASSPHAPSPTQSKQHHCPNHHSSPRGGMTLPVASGNRCPVCSPSGIDTTAPRTSYESLHSIEPLPRYTRYAPTGASAIRLEARRSAPSGTSLSPASPTLPSMPPSPPPAYVGRGPTASSRRAVY